MSIKGKNVLLVFFSDKALTWDVIVKKGREGPGRYVYCVNWRLKPIFILEWNAPSLRVSG